MPGLRVSSCTWFLASRMVYNIQCALLGLFFKLLEIKITIFFGEMFCTTQLTEDAQHNRRTDIHTAYVRGETHSRIERHTHSVCQRGDGNTDEY